MYKKITPIVLILSIFSFSCGSKPAPAPQAQQEECPVETPVQPQPDPSLGPPDQNALDALSRAKEETEQARKRVLDIGGDEAFPEDWLNAETMYQNAGNGTRETRKDVENALAQYKNALDAYNALFQKGLPDYVAARTQELRNARQEALEAGIENLAPDYLDLADKSVEEAGRQYENGDYYAASDTAHNALLLYRAIKTGVEAYNKRQKIIDNDLAHYDQENFDSIDVLALNALEVYARRNGKDALDKAEDVLNRYTVCLNTAWKACATEYGAFAATEKQNARNAKADVAVRSNFQEADMVYNQGVAAFKTNKFEDAVTAYDQAKTLFMNAGAMAVEKREAADAAIRVAEEKTKESDSIARNAALILEGDSQ
jgi:hypothetical protein